MNKFETVATTGLRALAGLPEKAWKPTLYRLDSKVKVYYNLHNHKWSIMPVSGPYAGKVIGHADSVIISLAEFKVSEAGRQRVLKEKRKNVHAFVVGTLFQCNGFTPRYGVSMSAYDDPISQKEKGAVAVSYNPYKGGSFYRKDTGADIRTALLVKLKSDRSVYAVDIK